MVVHASPGGRGAEPARGGGVPELVAVREGVYRLRAEGPGELSAESNPMVVGEEGMRILWADLQIHTNFSDGTGIPEDVLRYARDVAALDVAAITDHDHWGMLFLDQHPSLWDHIREQSARFHQPGSFVTFLGYEWTSWIHGHRHVLYLDDDGEVLSSIDPRYDEPEELWDALRGRSALTVAHHSAGEPHFHWYLEILPRLTTRAGFEIGSGMNINVVVPEDAAEQLRKATG